jgi:Asp/Glu/hydantoin racemase
VSRRPRIALIHATPVAMQPVADAFRALWPEAETVNLLDDALSLDRAREDRLTPAMTERILALAAYARGLGADGILFTCSAFGPAIEAAALESPMPVLKPNEAMFELALRAGRHIGMVATFAASVAGMTAEFDEQAALAAPGARLTALVEPAAMTALRAGDAETHNRLVAAKAAELPPCDAVMLAHFSTSRAAAAVRATVSVPVLTSPDSAVAKLRRLLAPGG